MRPSYRLIAGTLGLAVFILGALSIQRYSAGVNQPGAKTASSLSFSSSQTETPAAVIVTSAAAPSTPSTTASTAPKPKIKPLPTPAIATSTIQAQKVTSSGLALQKALVNIVCLSSKSSIPSISGTGVIIDSRGIILTAAHVAQLFLLQDFLGKDTVQCLVRTGSPARRAYLAEPIYVSPSWITANPKTLATKSPIGNGEYDVALLGITDTATSTPLPSTFPYVSLSSESPSANEPVAIASYGAQYLDSAELNYSLYQILVFASIGNRYTYDTNSVDLFSIQGSAASQEGSSGGGVANANGQLIGTITTSSIEGSIQSRQLNAVTTGHLRRTYQLDMGQSLDSALQSANVSSLIANFHSESLKLGQILTSNLNL